MKANELIIGDWVKYGNRFAIVKGIDTNLCHIMVSCNGNDELIWETYDNIEPIPITHEILEKNGFVVESGFCHGNPLQYCVLVEGLWIYISGENYFEGNLEYVHQLQHALKLCGIEKKIEL